MPSHSDVINPVLLTLIANSTATRTVVVAVPLTAERARHLVTCIHEAEPLAKRRSFQHIVYEDSDLRVFPSTPRLSLPRSILSAARQLSTDDGPHAFIVDVGPSGMDWTPRLLQHSELRVGYDYDRLPAAWWYVKTPGWTWGEETSLISRRTLLAFLCRVVPDNEVRAAWRRLAAEDTRVALQVAEGGAKLSGEPTGRGIIRLLEPEDLLPLTRCERKKVREGALRLLGKIGRRPSEAR